MHRWDTTDFFTTSDKKGGNYPPVRYNLNLGDRQTVSFGDIFGDGTVGKWERDTGTRTHRDTAIECIVET